MNERSEPARTPLERLAEQRLSFLQVTDMMLQDQNYPDWAGAARRFWKRGNNRIVLFWCVFPPHRLGGLQGGACFGAIPAFYFRRSMAALILLQSVSAPLIRGNQWTRQGRGAKRGPAQRLSAKQMLRTTAAGSGTLIYQWTPCSAPKRRDASGRPPRLPPQDRSGCD